MQPRAALRILELGEGIGRTGLPKRYLELPPEDPAVVHVCPELSVQGSPTVRVAVRSCARAIVGSEAIITAASATIRSIGIVLSFNHTTQQLKPYYNAKQPAFNQGSVEGRFQRHAIPAAADPLKQARRNEEEVNRGRRKAGAIKSASL